LLILEAREKFDAWRTANPNADTVREYIVREEDLKAAINTTENSTDNNNNSTNIRRSSRLSHFAPRIFSDSLPTSNAAKRALKKGSLTLNGSSTVSGGRILLAGDVLAYNNSHTSGGGFYDRRTAVPADPVRAERFCKARLRLLKALSNPEMTHCPLRVLYEDDCMAIVCKPAGVHTLSWKRTLAGGSLCLDEILPLLLQPGAGGDKTSAGGGGIELNDDESLPAPMPKHRLDQRVAGPVVVAKSRRASVEISRSFEEKTVAKEYRAIVVGDVTLETIKGLEGVSRVVDNSSTELLSFSISSDVEGRPSETDVRVLGTTPCNVNGILTDLALFPKTGRKHQLRIHCSKVLGTPILGDDLYWGEDNNDDNESESVSVRKGQGLYLYCKRVSIDHPLLGEKRAVSAEIEEPLRFDRTRKKARKGYEWTRENDDSGGDETGNSKGD
jgi:23S rRNA-/tRNA-specific pseudouridylate synthase